MNWEVRIMRSGISCFNAALFRKNLGRFWPLWGMASFIGVLFPLALVLEILRRPQYVVTELDITSGYYSIAGQAAPIVCLIYAVLCAMAVWNYLYSARSVGMMHSLPIRREGIFLTNLVSGLAMMLIPFAVTGAVCVAVSLAVGAFDAGSLAVTVLLVLGNCLFYFASATFAAFLTGNLLALPVIYFLLHFLEVLLDYLVCSIAAGFFVGVEDFYSGTLEWLCPTVYLLRNVGVDYIREDVVITPAAGEPYTSWELVDVTLENGHLVGFYALAGAVLLVLAYLLYRRRSSERAGDVMAAGWLRPVFQCVVTALAALAGGVALYELIWRGLQYSAYYEAVPLAVCLSVGGLIGYYAAAMLLKKTLRVFRGSWKGAAAVVVCCGALCAGLHADVLGIETRVPDLGEVRQLELRLDNNTYTLYAGEDDAVLKEALALHQSVTADVGRIRELDENDYDYEGMGAETISGLQLDYTLKNGLTLHRYYSVPMSRERMEEPGTYEYLMDQLANSETMKMRRIHLGDSRYVVEGGYCSTEFGGGVDLGSREAGAILEAVGRDLAAGAWGECDWFNQREGLEYAVHLELTFRRTDQESGSDWITIDVRPEMTHTVDCLLELGLVTREDLVQRIQLYPEAYPETAWEAVPDSGNVIGGADMLTSVMVMG